jgi:hypothetical protein
MKASTYKKYLSGQSNLSALKWFAGILAAFVVVFAASPWGAYERAKMSNHEKAYERFLDKHPDSMFVPAVRTRLARLKLEVIRNNPTGKVLQEFLQQWSDTPSADSARQLLQDLARNLWLELQNSEDPATLQRFETDYAGTPEAGWAAERRTDLLPRLEWKRLESSCSLAELEAFIRKYSSHEAAGQARQRIVSLCGDAEWVSSQDSLELYRKHLSLVPESPRRAEFEKRVIDLEVAEIARGEHGKLPPADPVQITGGTEADMEIENQTAYTLTVRYSGRESYRFDLSARQTRNVKLATGPYKVAATVSSPGVIPFAGSDTLQGGRYSSKFYIESHRW